MQFVSMLLAAAISIGTIIYGYRALKKGEKGNIKNAIIKTVSAFALVMMGAIISTIFGGNAFAETVTTTAQAAGISNGEGLKYFIFSLLLSKQYK